MIQQNSRSVNDNIYIYIYIYIVHLYSVVFLFFFRSKKSDEWISGLKWQIFVQHITYWVIGVIRHYKSKARSAVITNITIFLSLSFFGLLSSSLLLFPQRFGRYVLRPSSGVCRTREPSRNFEIRPLLKPPEWPVLIPLAITGYKC